MNTPCSPTILFCGHCKCEKPTFVCARCKTRYCSATCQRSAWPIHKASCVATVRAAGISTTHPPTDSGAAGKKQTPCFFARLGDVLHCILLYLPQHSLCLLDAAMTNRQDRATCWLPRLRGLDMTDEELHTKALNSLDASDERWLQAVKWLRVRRMALPHCWSVENAEGPALRACQNICVELPHLTSLDLYEDDCRRSNQIDDACLTNVALLRRLEHLYIYQEYPGFTRLGVHQNLAGLTELKTLRLYGSGFSNHMMCFEAIGRLTRLQELEIGDWGFNTGAFQPPNYDATCMSLLGGLVDLRKLTVTGTHVSDAGLARLQVLINLEYLALTGCTFAPTSEMIYGDFKKVSEAAVMRLVEACPLLREVAIESLPIDDASEELKRWLENRGVDLFHASDGVGNLYGFEDP